MSTSKDPLKKLTHVRMSKGGSKTQNRAPSPSEYISHSDTHKNSINSYKLSAESGDQAKVFNPAHLASDDIKPGFSTHSHDDYHSFEEKEDRKPFSRNLPGFLSRFSAGLASKTDLKSEGIFEGDLASRALAVIEGRTKDNPNSFGSIFTHDHEEMSGIKRVFKKSIAFLVINLMLFGILALVSINLLTIPLWFSTIISLFYIVSSCLFFIIVADRSYLWLSIAGQVVLLLLVHSFLGQGFDIITILIALFIAALIFSAYSELEKIQLGSRLFFISHITGESIRILTTVVAVVLSLGLFNSIVSVGTEAYVESNILSSNLVINKVIIGENPNLSLNRLFLKGNIYFTPDNSDYTFRDFLTFNYKAGKSVLTQDETNDIIIACQTKPSSTTVTCNKELNTEKDSRLTSWQQEAYPKINLNLDKVVNEQEFKTIVKQHYLYLIRDFSSYDSGFSVIPIEYVVPAFFSLALFALLLIIKSVLGWLAYITIWIVWKILGWVGFVRIEVEAVEAEIVSI